MRGQVTLFIIVGLFLLLGFGLFFAFTELALEDDARTSVLSGAVLQFVPPQNYVDFCVEEHVVVLLRNMSFSDSFFLYQDTNFEYVYTLTQKHQPLSYSMVEEYLDEHLPDLIRDCVDSGIYADLGYDVNRGVISTETTLSPERVTVKLDFPFSISNGDQTFEFTEHETLVPVAYGRLLITLKDAVNAELQDSWFDQVRYMHRTDNLRNDNPLIHISKFKPYPHTLYQFVLNQSGVEFTVSVAIEGVDSFVSDAILLESQLSVGKSQTSCRIAELCYADVSESTCDAVGGSFVSESVCSVVESSEVEFADCNGIISGSSWCEYDSGVGGRFYRSSCVNGNIETESCRDFRQELCVESGSVAKCRVNTAQSCSQCTDELCCSASDCKWLDNSSACIPAVPLGHMFWEPSSICQNSLSVLSQGVTDSDSSKICSLLGDCGQTFNYYGDSNGDTNDLRNILQDRGQLKWDVSYSFSTVPKAEESSLSGVLAQLLTEVESALDVGYDSYINPEQSINDSSAASVSFCPSYVPNSQACSFCGQDRPCSEYACRSLGTLCTYDVVSGICAASVLNSSLSIVSVGNISQGTPRSGFVQFALEAIATTDPLNVTFTTSAEALCRPVFLPSITFSQSTAPDLSDGNFSKNHTLQLRFVNDLPVIDKLAPFFSEENFDGVVQKIIDFKYRLDQLRSKYPGISKFTPTFMPALNAFVDSASEHGELVNALLSDLESRKVSVFFTCLSHDGVQAVPGFVSFGLQSSCQDELEAQVIYDADPFTIDEFYVETNVLAQCSYTISNDSTLHEMTCPKSQEDLYDLNYRCSAPRPSVSELEVRCVEFSDVEDREITVIAGNTSSQTRVALELQKTEQILRNGTITMETGQFVCSENIVTFNGSIGDNVTSTDCVDCQFFNETVSLTCSKQIGCGRDTIVRAKFIELDPLHILDTSIVDSTLYVVTQGMEDLDRDVVCSVNSLSTRSKVMVLEGSEQVVDISHTAVGEFITVSCIDRYGSQASTVVLRE